MDNDVARSVIGGGVVLLFTLIHLAQIESNQTAVLSGLLAIAIAVAVTARVTRLHAERRNKEIREIRAMLSRIRADQKKARKDAEKFDVEVESET